MRVKDKKEVRKEQLERAIKGGAVCSLTSLSELLHSLGTMADNAAKLVELKDEDEE